MSRKERGWERRKEGQNQILDKSDESSFELVRRFVCGGNLYPVETEEPRTRQERRL